MIDIVQCPNPPNSTSDVNAQFAEFIEKGAVIGESVPPINNKPAFLSPSFTYDFIAVAEAGEYHVLNLLGSKCCLTVTRSITLFVFSSSF